MKPRREMLGVAGLMLAALPAFSQRSVTAKETTADALKQKLDRGEKVLVIDVRTDEEVQSGSIPGAIHPGRERLLPVSQGRDQRP